MPAIRLGVLSTGLVVALYSGTRALADTLTPYPVPVVAAGLLSVVLLGAVAGVRTTHPFPALGPANVITALRATLVALVTALLWAPAVGRTAALVVWVASVAAALDGVDGWLSRRTGMESRFGARFDMETDAWLILALGVLVWRYDKAGAWVLLSGALRYLFIAAGWGLAWMRGTLPPSLRRKIVCVVQIVGLIVAMAPVVRPPLSTFIALASLLALAWSFAVDVAWLWRHRHRHAIVDLT